MSPPAESTRNPVPVEMEPVEGGCDEDAGGTAVLSPASTALISLCKSSASRPSPDLSNAPNAPSTSPRSFGHSDGLQRDSSICRRQASYASRAECELLNERSAKPEQPRRLHASQARGPITNSAASIAVRHSRQLRLDMASS